MKHYHEVIITSMKEDRIKRQSFVMNDLTSAVRVVLSYKPPRGYTVEKYSIDVVVRIV